VTDERDRHTLPWRVAELERTVKGHTERMDNQDRRINKHDRALVQQNSNSEHLLRAVDDISEEIRKFRNYALGTMVGLIITLMLALMDVI
jgi:hypothetical protein